MIEGRIKNSVSYNASFNGDKALQNHLSLLVAVVGPFLTALALGFLFGLACGVSAGFYSGNLKTGLAWGVTAGAWMSVLTFLVYIGLWWWMRWRLANELGWNLSYKSRVRKELTMVMSDGQGHLTRARVIGIDDEAKLVEFARRMLKNPNQSTAEKSWTSGPYRVFVVSEYVAFRDFCLGNDYASWNSEADHARGWHFTKKGYAYLKCLAEGKFSVSVIDTEPRLANGMSRTDFSKKYGEDLTPLEDAR